MFLVQPKLEVALDALKTLETKLVYYCGTPFPMMLAAVAAPSIGGYIIINQQ